jgi:hypothetical protein
VEALEVSDGEAGELGVAAPLDVEKVVDQRCTTVCCARAALRMIESEKVVTVSASVLIDELKSTIVASGATRHR